MKVIKFMLALIFVFKFVYSQECDIVLLSGEKFVHNELYQVTKDSIYLAENNSTKANRGISISDIKEITVQKTRTPWMMCLGGPAGLFIGATIGGNSSGGYEFVGRVGLGIGLIAGIYYDNLRSKEKHDLSQLSSEQKVKIIEEIKAKHEDRTLVH